MTARSCHRVMGLVGTAALLLACGADAPTATWEHVPAPAVVDQTDDVVVVDGKLADGTYWGTAARVSGSDEVVFRVTKARFGAFCEAWAAEQGRAQGCLNDYDVESDPAALAAVADGAAVSVAEPEGPGTNRSINPSTLSHLLAGDNAAAPTDYLFVPFPFIVVVEDGVVVEAQQFWVP